MEDFARLFILRINLQESRQKNQGSMSVSQEEKWRSIDRLVALYGPPDVVNHTWASRRGSTTRDGDPR